HRLVCDARALGGAGCFPILLEGVPGGAAARFTPELPAPTIGLGARAPRDGHELGYHHLLRPSHTGPPPLRQRYAELGARTRDALERYAAEGRSGVFPGPEHTYAMPDDELALFEASAEEVEGFPM